MKRSALEDERVEVLRMAFRARKVYGTFEKRAPGTLYFDSFLVAKGNVSRLIKTQAKTNQIKLNLENRGIFMILYLKYILSNELMQ